MNVPFNGSVKDAKKAIWQMLQAYTGDDDLWDHLTFDDNLHPDAVTKARNAIFNQIERKL